MKQSLPLVLTSLLAVSAHAESSRELDAHEHGVGQLNMAFEGKDVLIEIHAPGADIVGFEYEAETAEDRAKIDQAVATLAKPLDLFVMPQSAKCSVVSAHAELESEDEEHAHDDDHKDEHEEHAHDNDHDDHKEHAEASHTEFHAEYRLACAEPSKIDRIDFAYFTTFPNALELEVQLLTAKGAQGFEVERDAPTLDLKGMF